MTQIERYRMISILSVAALFCGVAFAVSRVMRSGTRVATAEQHATAAQVQLSHIRARLVKNDAERSALFASLDSLAAVAAQLRRTPRTFQRTRVIVDTAESVQLVSLVATLEAERDTAASARNMLAQDLADALEIAAQCDNRFRAHLARDAVRDSALIAATDSVRESVAEIVPSLRRPLWRRAAGWMAKRTRDVTLVGIGVAIVGVI
jgi:hypothetical protein